jgi:hypothetical protein
VTWTPYNVLSVMYGFLGPEKGDTVRRFSTKLDPFIFVVFCKRNPTSSIKCGVIQLIETEESSDMEGV